ncbi:hypothetical protein [Streptomyces sp. NBC_00091]|uniref:P-loop NTPase n=1 Tax=Streptomyces sp. NBC_00091 TaxID=2975648 RepID=UPI002257F95C|nr:hypothetical protein [Streptomyces sp. NBC_00091]MCX5377576.1 hypothetical protein [Streptomyces sp. NBC_00091]
MMVPSQQDGADTTDAVEAERLRERVLDIVRTKLGAAVTINWLEELSGGHTGAMVVRADVMGAGSQGPDGHVILKLSSDDEERQHEAHQRFQEALADYGEKHLPKLYLTAADDRLRVDIYGIAGKSVEYVKPGDRSGAAVLTLACRAASSELLAAQLTGYTGGMRTVQQVLEAWLRPGFVLGPRGRALQETRQAAGIPGITFAFSTEVLPDPWSLLQEIELMGSEVFILEGAAHGDLHLRNILVNEAFKDRVHYWLIDVNWGATKPLLYDQAYLETAALLAMDDRLKLAEPLEALITVDTGGLFELGAQDFGNVVKGIREGAEEIIIERQENRKDSLDRQFLLARLGAALNFASKKMPETKRVAAYRMAGWIARQYLSRYHKPLLARMLADAQGPRDRQDGWPAALTAAEAEDLKARIAPLLPDVHSGLDRFLIVEDGVLDADMAHLLAHRWSVIIDLNPASETTGLASLFDESTADYQTAFRGTHSVPAAARNAVPWVMAGGWESHGERAPADYKEWRRLYRQIVEDVFDGYSASSPNRSATVVCLTSNPGLDRRSQWILEAIEDRYDDPFDPLQAALGSPELQVLLEEFARGGAVRSLGDSVTLPAEKGTVQIPHEVLVRLETDLVVVHSRIVEAQLRDEPTDEFWRGRPPSWLDLDARLDIPRDLRADLRERLLDVFGRQSSMSLELFHTPGAGGTTLARRIAWDLHREHPVVLVNKYSPGTADRVDQVYRLTGKTVLVVAESADVSQSEREDLYRKLDQRNAPTILMWVTRTNSTPAGVGDRSGDRKFYLDDPMSPREVREFQQDYALRARSPRARAAVELLASPGSPPQQLSPFYFGLAAYEEDFQGTAQYVEAHLSQFTDEQRRVASYLALVTLHAQRGVPFTIVRRWLTGRWGGHAASSDSYRSDLATVLGADLRHLVVENDDQVRILHPTIAQVLLDAVIEAPRGQSRWAMHLADLAIELIDQVAGRMGTSNEPGRKLLENLFITRGNKNGQQRRFSDLIMMLDEGHQGQAYRVLLHLTHRYPTEAHFWMHLGRYHQWYKGLGDGQAQRYVEKAIEITDGSQSVHFHALGKLHRDGVEEALKLHRGGPQEALDRIGAQYAQGLVAFDTARRINPEDEHNYVTPVQMIAAVLERLPRLAGQSSLVGLLHAGGEVAEWADAQLRLALSLLDACETAMPEHAGNSYLVTARQRIDDVHGKASDMVVAWRDVSVRWSAHPGFVVALARGLLVNVEDTDEEVSEDVLRTVVRLYDSVFEDGGYLADHDLELWFRAYRRLPEYSELAALERFAQIVEQRGSVVAHYYLYVIHFMRWLDTEEYDQRNAARHFAEARQLTGRRSTRWSYEWAAKQDPVEGPVPGERLAHFKELGERRPVTSDWERSEQVCRRVRGVIRRIDGPRSGWVAVEGGEMQAYFVPRSDFHADTHVNRILEFDLGFAQDGLRAWRPELAKEQRLLRDIREIATGPDADDLAPSLQGQGRRAPAASLEPLPPLEVSPQVRQQAVQQVRQNGDAACRLVIDELLSLAQEKRNVTSTMVGAQLQETFGDTRYRELLRGRKLGGFVVDLGYRTEPTKHGQFAVLPASAAGPEVGSSG